MGLKRVWIIPLLTFIFTSAAFLVSYVIAVAVRHVTPIWPYISDSGTLPPESCIFGQLLNVASLFLACTVYLRHRQIVEFYWHHYKQQGRWRGVSAGLLILGYTSAFGVSMLANFQEGNVIVIHYIGALLAFGGGLIYIWAQTIFTYMMNPKLVKPIVSHSRLILCLFASVFFCSMIIFGPVLGRQPDFFTRAKHRSLYQWNGDESNFLEHVLGTCSEWGLAICFQLYILSFAIELRHVYCHAPKLRLMPHSSDDGSASEILNYDFPMNDKVYQALCPSGSTGWNSNCYIFQTNATEFATAEITCKSLSGDLVSVHDAFTNALLAGEAPNYFQQNGESDFWIGGTLLMHLGKWSWIDNSPFDFNDWNKGEPQNMTGNGCIAISSETGAWSSQDCFKKKPYVCNVTPKPTNAPYIECPLGWGYLEVTQSCYGAGNITHHNMTWEQAEERCEEQGAHLVSIHSVEEYLFCESYDLYAWGGPFWTGLRSDDGGKTWKWSDNSPFDFQYWGTGAPNATDGCATCGLEKLTVKNCNESYLFICKKSALTGTKRFIV